MLVQITPDLAVVHDEILSVVGIPSRKSVEITLRVGTKYVIGVESDTKVEDAVRAIVAVVRKEDLGDDGSTYGPPTGEDVA
jgi:hypothetical protein